MANVFEHLRELERDQERAYYELGPVWASPPHLCDAKYEPGVSTRQAVDYLLNRIERHVSDGPSIRAILASSFEEMDTPLTLNQLLQLNIASREPVHTVLRWVEDAGGLQLRDFSDGGARFLRLVMRMRPHTIARRLSEATE